jgi:sulfatase modifying factor 1
MNTSINWLKIFALLSFILFFHSSLPAQCFDNLKKEGDRYNQKAVYEEAITQYLAALLCPDLEQDQRIELIQLIKSALLARLNQLNDALDRAKKSEQEATQALKDLEVANEKTKQALADLQKANDVTQRALADLQNATQSILDNILQSAEEDILNLNYNAALAKIQNAAQLKVDNEKVGLAMMELVFFFNESHQYQRAIRLSETLSNLLETKDLIIEKDSLNDLRRFLSEARPERYQQLEARYYPIMIDIPGGTFEMGCNDEIDTDCRYDEMPHPVKLSAYRLAQYEITNWQYHLYCVASGQDSIERTREPWPLQGNLPVVNVNWYDGVEYSNWLSDQKDFGRGYNIEKEKVDKNNLSSYDELKWKVRLTGKRDGFRLPTEAEWEYAAQGGLAKEETVYSGSNTLNEVAWYVSNSDSRPQKVGAKLPNRLGIYDMSGNVYEWCWDWYGNYETEIAENPQGADSGNQRVLRGGSWFFPNNYCRVAYRSSLSRNDPYNRTKDHGFRVAQGQ